MLFCSIYCTLDIFGHQGDAEGIRRCHRRKGDGLIPMIPLVPTMVFGSPVRPYLRQEKKIGKVGWLIRLTHIMK